jgi:thiamine pyrophosphate-dependent acetolactate synthase large subunit-like protein
VQRTRPSQDRDLVALDHTAVLAITGMQETSVLGTGYQQEVHTDRLYADLPSYNLVVENLATRSPTPGQPASR